MKKFLQKLIFNTEVLPSEGKDYSHRLKKMTLDRTWCSTTLKLKLKSIVLKYCMKLASFQESVVTLEQNKRSFPEAKNDKNME